MHCLTAIIRVQAGHESTVRDALVKVGEFARLHEPDTIGYHVTQDPDNRQVLATFERFTDRAAMERHNEGAGSKAFFATAGGLLDGPVTVMTGEEIWTR